MKRIIYCRSDLFTFILILTLFSCIASSRSAFSADLIQNSPEIKWIAEYSSSQDFSTNQNFFSQLIDFVAGDEALNFQRPMSVLASRSGLITVLDQEMRSIVQIDPLQQQMDLISSSTAVPFPSLLALCLNDDNEIYITDSQDNQIYVLSSQEEDPVLLNKSLQLSRPTGIAYHLQNKEIWVVETTEHRISVLDPKGNFLRHIGSRGLNSGEFNYPSFIWIDRSGLAYVVDTMNFRVQILDRDGSTITIFGEAGDASGYFARPKGIATDSKGNIYVVDALFHTVQIFDRTGTFLENFGRQGQGEGEFWMPVGIYIDEKDKIYIADSYNSRIQIFQLLKKDPGEE